jgi:predicted RNA-binding Zn-ribbon protein involved in translation (DUF1610 family)
MSAKEPAATRRVRTPDSAFSFSFAVVIGLLLFIAGLIISLTLGDGSIIGLLFGVPLIIAGMVLPLIMMRGQFTQNEVAGPCPYCGAAIRTSDSTLRLQCPACHQVVTVRDMKLHTTES